MGDTGRRLAEIWRVLKPGGLYQGTILSKRDAQFGHGPAVAPDTFIRGATRRRTRTIIVTWPASPRYWPASSWCR
jgi:hypothetical protein